METRLANFVDSAILALIGLVMAMLLVVLVHLLFQLVVLDVRTLTGSCAAVTGNPTQNLPRTEPR